MAKLKTVITPKGVLSWPYIAKPDTRYNPEGVFKTSLILTAAEAAPLMEACTEAFVNEFGQAKMAKAMMPFEVNEESGEVTFKFKSKRQPRLYDAKGKQISKIPQVSSGTIAKVNAAINPYNKGINTGVSFYLNDIQIIELVEYQAGPKFTAEDGFEAEDDTESFGTENAQVANTKDSDF